MIVDNDTGRARVPLSHRSRHAMGGLFKVSPVIRLLAIRHQADNLETVGSRILQAGGGGHRVGCELQKAYHRKGRGSAPNLKRISGVGSTLARRSDATRSVPPLWRRSNTPCQ